MQNKTYVWELAVRLFHWALVATVLFLWVSAEVGGNWMTWHLRAGYVALTLVVFRILWGLVGGAHARFGDFLYGPRALFAYAKTFWRRQGEAEGGVYAGHTPLGGVGIFLMLLLLLAQAGTGLFANDDVSTEGPWAHRVGKHLSDTITAFHDYGFDVLIAVIAVHIAVVFFYLFYKRQNLIRPMVTGYKTLAPSQSTSPRPVAGLHVRAILVLGIAALAVGLLVKAA